MQRTARAGVATSVSLAGGHASLAPHCCHSAARALPLAKIMLGDVDPWEINLGIDFGAHGIYEFSCGLCGRSL